MTVATLVRGFALGALLAVTFTSPAAASTSESQCYVCTVTGECPLDIWSYHDECQFSCGFWTYPGACWDDPTDETNPCGLANARIICYEPN